MPYVETEPGVKVYYEEFGSGHPIVFVNAGLATHHEWEHQVADLALEFRTITFDWRGTGASDKPNGPYTLDVLVADLRALIEDRDAAGCTLVAHGIGAHGALVFAERHPELVGRLVLTGAGPWYAGDRDGLEGGFSAEFAEWWGGQVSGTANTAVEAYTALGREFLFRDAPDPAVLSWFVGGALQWPLYVFNAYCADMAGIDHRERLGRIAHPARVFQGRHDRKQRYAGGRLLAELLPAGELVTFEDSAHMVCVEQVKDFTRELAVFARS